MSVVSFLSPVEKEALRQLGKPKAYRGGDILFQQGSNADFMYKVLKGKVSLFRLMPNGDEKLFKVFMSGQYVAEMAMFMSPRRYPMTARIDQDSELLAFQHHHVVDIMSSNPETSKKVMAYMSNHIFQLMDTQDILTQVNSLQRLVMKLAQLCRQQQQPTSTIKTTAIKVALPISKKLFAMQLGIKPETLSRLIKKLKLAQLVEESDAFFIIHNTNQLCDFVKLTPDIFNG